MPFKLDTILYLPQYVGRDTYKTILDDKSGYYHLLLSVESRTFFGTQLGGWYFVYNTLPFGWKISPFVYHSTGLVVSNFFRSIGIPCSLIHLVLLAKQASEIKEFKFAPNAFPANSLKVGERARLMKSLLFDRGLLQADQPWFKHSKVAQVEQSIETAVEVTEVWNENSLYEMTPEFSMVASILAVITAIPCSA